MKYIQLSYISHFLHFFTLLDVSVEAFFVLKKINKTRDQKTSAVLDGYHDTKCHYWYVHRHCKGSLFGNHKAPNLKTAQFLFKLIKISTRFVAGTVLFPPFFSSMQCFASCSAENKAVLFPETGQRSEPMIVPQISNIPKWKGRSKIGIRLSSPK